MKKIGFAVLGLVLALAGRVEAQVFTPTYQAPYNSNDIGIYVADDAVGGDLAVEGILRRGQVGLRLGVANSELLAGIDYRSPLSVAGASPLALALTLGGQGAFGDDNVFGGQVGLSVGGRIASPGLTVVPYIHPRAAVLFGDGDSEFKVLADLGVDLDFNRNLALRFGANLGDGADFGIGVAFRR